MKPVFISYIEDFSGVSARIDVLAGIRKNVL
jgi:hypothetical protein